MPTDGPGQGSSMPAAHSAPADVVLAPRRRTGPRLKLPVKTTFILLTLLIASVGICGTIFYISTRSALEQNKAAQVNQFAYGIAGVLEQQLDNYNDNAFLQTQLEAVGRTPNLEFAVITDPSQEQIAGYIGDSKAWDAYLHETSNGQHRAMNRIGLPHEVVHNGNHTAYVVCVPIFEPNPKHPQSHIIGYLHVALSSDSDAAQLRFLQAFVLFTCMAVVLLAVPIAGMIARHLTIPIQRLAEAAHALASGQLHHRVQLRRSDELGELADAFNRMADTVQQQQDHIKRINAGLELKVKVRTAELEKVNQRLTAEMAEKEDFLRAVSHDLNAPLRNIAGMASMLVLKYQDTLEKDALQRLERIQKNVEVECELINELLELSRIKSRREKIESVNLGELLHTVVDGFAADFETKKIKFTCQGEFPIMQCEKSRLRQVFQNLIDNGIKYMREDSERQITVSVNWNIDDLVFTVSDTGMGIAPEDLPHLFHVFRRAKNASVMKIPGKGVGLASVKSIVENYNGRLWVESVQGRGTTFHFALPRAHFQVPKEVAV